MKMGKIVFNKMFMKEPTLRAMAEVRYVKPNYRGSFPVIGVYLSRHSLDIVVMGFYMILGKIRPLLPTPLTAEEKKMAEDLLKAEEDVT